MTEQSTMWTSDAIVKALSLNAASHDMTAKNISIDTRTLQKNDLYVALKGENMDGHQFIQHAFDQGACGVVIEEPYRNEVPHNKTYFIVENTQKALHQLGQYARAQTNPRVVAITGSVGKTTLKEWLACILKNFGETVCSPKSYNNHWGVPLSLARLSATSAYGVFEIGMNHGGEISPLSGIVRPHIAVITTIAPAHIGHFKNLEGIAEEKSQIFKGLEPGGTAILNKDNRFYQFLADKAHQQGAENIIGVGKDTNAKVQLVGYEVNTHNKYAHVHINAFGEKLSYTVSFTAEHLIFNSLFVFAACHALGIPLKEVASSMSNLEPLQGRGYIHHLKIKNQPFTLLDDAYNANPESMKAAILDLAAHKNAERKIAVLGDMLELGTFSKAYHEGLLEVIQKANIKDVFLIGSQMKYLFDILPPEINKFHFIAVQEVYAPLINFIRANDVVLIKSSHGMRLAELVNYLTSTTHQNEAEVA